MGESQKKKLFPKLNKNIKGFMTNESGKMNKKTVLEIASLWAMLLCSSSDAIALNTHANGTNGPAGNQTTYDYNITYTDGTASCNVSPISQIVNGHYSATPTATIASSIWGVTSVVGTTSHASHASHASHGSHAQW